MRRRFLSIAIVLLLCSHVSAKPVSESTAKTVATNYFTHVTGRTVSEATLTFTGANSDRTLYYAFTINSNQGYVLVTADDRCMPILGYNVGSGFVVPRDERVGIKDWLSNYGKEINYIVVHNLPADAAITAAWQSNLQGQYAKSGSGVHPTGATNAQGVTPLLPCNWDQDPYYDADCPYDSAANAQTVTGCPATAMGMIMKKWGYPSLGAGNHSYATAKYGTLSANFGGTTYNWANMPDSLSATNSDIAQLMLHLGVSVEMQYGTAASGGSGAYVIASTAPSLYCSEYAYKTFFRYDSTTLHGYARSNYGDSAWMAMMRADLDLGRPMQYDGQGKGGGHTWVCDGYDTSGLFHMNWGWSGSDNGYYTLSTLNPGTLGTGGGDGDFNAGQECIFGIQPIAAFTSGKPFGFALADSIRINPDPVSFTAPFVVTANIKNANSTDFKGSISASLFDQKGAYVAYVQVLTNQTIAANSTSGVLTFSTAGLVLVPGQYTLGIYTSDNSKSWTVVGAGSFASSIPLTILGPTAGIRLSSAMEVAPTNWIYRKPVSVTVNVQNNTLLPFKGAIRADIYDLTGNYIENIGVYNDTTGLLAGESYSSPLTFSLDSVLAPTGTYILALSEMSSTGDTSLCGGDLYPNPVYIQISVPALQPDIYEPNNTQDSAYVFNPVFVGDSAVISTAGANLQFGSQNDYFKVNFPAGYSYTITTVLHDAYTEPSLYSVDAGVTILDSGVWSSTYDGAVPTPTVLANGGSLVYLVGPWNEGGAGTYNLTMKATRSTLGVARGSSPDENVSIYPNPANTVLSLSSMTHSATFTNVEIVNMLGQIVKQCTERELAKNHMQIDVSNLQSGVYFVTLRSTNNVSSLKVVIDHNQ